MSLNTHLEALKKKHRDMSEAIDGLKVADMKKQKMRLKEQINRLTD